MPSHSAASSSRTSAGNWSSRRRFGAARSKRLRDDQLPAEVRDELAALWDGIVADVYDEVAGLKRRRAFGRAQVQRVLERVRDRFLQAERVVIVGAVHRPLAGGADWRHVAAGGAGGAASAVAEEVAAYGTVGTATTTAIVAAIAGEVLETYIAASARVQQYRRAGRRPDPGLVVTDLAQAAGYGDAAGRRATNRVARDAATWLSEALLTRTARRFARGLLPVVGVAIGGTVSAISVRRVTNLPLRPPSEDEVLRLASDVAADTDDLFDLADLGGLPPLGEPDRPDPGDRDGPSPPEG